MGKKTDFIAGAATATAITAAVAPHAIRHVALATTGGVLTGAGIITSPVVLPAVALAATVTSVAYGVYQVGAWLWGSEDDE